MKRFFLVFVGALMLLSISAVAVDYDVILAGLNTKKEFVNELYVVICKMERCVVLHKAGSEDVEGTTVVYSPDQKQQIINRYNALKTRYDQILVELGK